MVIQKFFNNMIQLLFIKKIKDTKIAIAAKGGYLFVSDIDK